VIGHERAMRYLPFVLPFLIACGASAASESSGSQQSENTSNSSGAEAPGVTVQLDTAGEGERAPLRYDFTVGSVEQAQARIAMTIHTAIGGQELPGGAIPAMIAEFTVETIERDEWTFRYRYTFDRVSVDPAGADPSILAQLEASLAPLARLRGEARVDARGQVLETHVEVPPDMPPALASSVQQMSDMMRQMVAPLPEEPVGVGAEWKTENTISESMGLRLRQRTHYRLAARDGNRVVLEIRLEQSGIPGPLDLEQPGTEAMLTALTGQAQATTTLRLDRLCPEQSHMELTMTQDATITAEGQTVPMHVDMQMQMSTGTRSQPR
jgi:hypothetical protein